jgi:CheY-like chemotaxis protein
MPEMDGLEATRQIRERQKNPSQPGHFNSPIAIAAMTANAMQGDRERCLGAGMDDYVSKPVRPEDLRVVVERWGVRAQASKQSEGATDSGLDNLSFAETTGRVAAKAETLRQEPPVDMERLLDFANGDPANLRELIELYIQQTGKQVIQLAVAIEARNADEVKRLAHSCCGASSTCGMATMIVLLRELERQGNEGLQSNAPQLTRDVEREFERIQKFLTDYLNTQVPPQLAKN